MTDNVLYQQTTGRKVPNSVLRSTKIVELLYPTDINISISYLPTHQNTTVYSLSRRFSQEHEWELDIRALQHIFNRWGFVSIDFCHTQKYQMSTVLFKSKYGSSVSRGCLPHNMGCIPTLSFHHSPVVHSPSQETGGTKPQSFS